MDLFLHRYEYQPGQFGYSIHELSHVSGAPLRSIYAWLNRRRLKLHSEPQRFEPAVGFVSFEAVQGFLAHRKNGKAHHVAIGSPLDVLCTLPVAADLANVSLRTVYRKANATGALRRVPGSRLACIAKSDLETIVLQRKRIKKAPRRSAA